MSDEEKLEIEQYEEGASIQEFKNDFEISSLLLTVGTLSDEVVDLARQRGLWSSVSDDEVEIRPDGLIYVPWTVYAQRLTKAFPLQWGIVPQGMPKMHDNLVVWGFYLIIRGALCGFSIGEQLYYPSNKTMSWTDAIEGAKSNALMRLCKGIGLFPELWNPSYVRDWKSKYAEKYTEEGKTKWRRKDSAFRTKTEAMEVIEVVPEDKIVEQLVPQARPSTDATQNVDIMNASSIQHLVDLKLFENGFSAATVLGRFNTKKMPLKRLEEMATDYRDWKVLLEQTVSDSKEATSQAIAKVNAGEKPNMLPGM